MNLIIANWISLFIIEFILIIEYKINIIVYTVNIFKQLLFLIE